MDISKVNTGMAGAGRSADRVTESEKRDQAAQNAMTTFQAHYGEKPKEARVVKKALDKDDFMRIMITEMKHQDPTKPMDADRMATQMAQVTSVEQLKNVSNAVEKLAEKSNASDRLAMSAMIGKTVTVDKGRFTHQKGNISPVNFDLPENAAKIKMTVLNEKGDEVASRVLEPMKAGSNVYNWDGMNESNLPSPTGTYMVRIEAENEKGGQIKINPISQETVVGITFEGGDANFLVGDTKSPQKVAFKNVTRIEGDATSRAKIDAQKEAQAAALQKGAGAQAGDGAIQLPPGLQEKLKSELQARGQTVAAAEPQNSEAPEANAKAEGFPNGLQE